MQAMLISGEKGCRLLQMPSRNAFAVFRDQQGASVAGAECMQHGVVRCEVRAIGRAVWVVTGSFLFLWSDTGNH